MKNQHTYLTHLRRFRTPALPVLLLLFAIPLSPFGPVAGGQEPQPERLALPESELSVANRTARFDQIAARLKSEEMVPVIVRLRAPFSTQTEVAGDGRAAAQRQAIDAARARLLAEVPLRAPDSVKTFRVLPLVAMTVDRAGLAALRNSSLVLDIQEDGINRPQLSTTTRLIGAVAARESGADGTGQTVAVLDTGVETTHPFLQGRIAAEACFSSEEADQSVTSLCPDRRLTSIGPGAATPCNSEFGCGHGTMTAGIIAGQGPLFSGVAPGARIISVQIFSRHTSEIVCGPETASCIGGFDSDILRALEYVYSIREEHRISAVNLSAGRGNYQILNCDKVNFAMKAAVDLLATADIPVIVPSGNRAQVGAIMFPACLSNVVSVGATDNWDLLFPFSNVVDYLSLLAPGVSVQTSTIGGTYIGTSGTSMSVAHVAGAWASLRQKYPTATPTEVLAALTRTGKIIDAKGLSLPRIQVDDALRELGNIVTPYAAPINLGVSLLASANVRLTWVDRSANETGFRISRRGQSWNEPWLDIGTVGPDQTSFDDRNFSRLGVYQYRVTALFAGGESLPSHPINLSIVLPPIPTPKIKAEVLASYRVDLTWDVEWQLGDNMEIFRYDSQNKVAQFMIPASAKRLSDTSLRPGMKYRYVARHIGSGRQGSNGTLVEVTTPFADISLFPEKGEYGIYFGMVAPRSAPDTPRLTRSIRLLNTARIPVKIQLEIRDFSGTNAPRLGDPYYNFPYAITDPVTGVTETGWPGQRLEIGSGEQRIVTVEFRRDIPRPVILPIAGLPFDLLPPLVVADFVVTATDGAAVDQPYILLAGQIETRARLINPLDTSQPATVDFKRDGNGVEVSFAVYDPNLDASLVTYQFYDQIGRPVGRPISYLPGPFLRSAQVLPGMSVTINRRFTNLERFNELRAVRVTIYDAEGTESALSIPVADLGSAAPR